jgi:hypothetical protein
MDLEYYITQTRKQRMKEIGMMTILMEEVEYITLILKMSPKIIPLKI